MVMVMVMVMLFQLFQLFQWFSGCIAQENSGSCGPGAGRADPRFTSVVYRCGYCFSLEQL